MPTIRRLVLSAASCVLLSVPVAVAQTPDPETQGGSPAAHLSFVGGEAYVDHGDRSEPAEVDFPVLDGDQLRTEEGRLEVTLPDGSLLHLDQFTTVDMAAPDLFRLRQGRVTLIVSGAHDRDGAWQYRVDTGVASVQTGGPGEFRVTSTAGDQGTEVELAVLRGHATLANELGAEEVRAGETALVEEGLAPGRPEDVGPAQLDAFDPTSAPRQDADDSTVSPVGVPAELEVYAGTFVSGQPRRMTAHRHGAGEGDARAREFDGGAAAGRRRTIDIAVYSNRRNGAIERVNPGDVVRPRGSLGNPGRTTGPAFTSRPALPRGAAGDRDDSPRPSSPRSDRTPSPAPARSYSYPRSAAGGFDSAPGATASEPGAPRQSSQPRSDTRPSDSGQGASSGGTSARDSGRGAPSGGTSIRGGGLPDSSAGASAPRYNPGAGGSRPSGSGLSQATPRGGRGGDPH